MALAAATQSLEFRLLGPLELRADGEDVTPKAAKLRALLALLVLRANEPVAADQLVEQLWDGKPPATAQNTLQHYVSELRKLLPAEALLTQAPGYLLRLEPGQVDLHQFEQLVEQGRHALAGDDAGRAAGLLDQALALWRGPALADFAYESWAVQEAQRLEELRLDAVENRVEARLALGRHRELVAELQTLVGQQPLRERLRRQLMLVLYRSGRQAEALEAYQRARETLVEELGIDPSPELQALYKQILNQDETLSAPTARAEWPLTNLLEPPTALIGREQELDELRELLLRADVRLITVTGAGGSGKTRLSLELARRLVTEFSDGVFLVELAPISDPELLLPTVAQALGVGERPDEPLEQTLTNQLRERDLLLLLDNFEQLLAAAPKLAELLARTQRLRVLVTSRAVLHLSGEHEYPLSPLSLPDLSQLADLDRLSGYEAVRLFIERARSVRPDFKITDDNAVAVAEICVRLDGLPLAIELAAARTRTLPPKALLQRLDQRLTLLTGGARDLPSRQQTLRGAIDWSYSLLTKPEQTLFARLSVFVGGCRIEAAEAVCNPQDELGPDLLDRLDGLIERSLLRQKEDPDGEPRFWMLQTIREYALERFEESAEAETLRKRQAPYFLEFVEGLVPLMLGPEEPDAFEQLRVEHENLRSVLRFSLDTGDDETALRLASGGLQRFWRIHGHLTEGRRWLEQALANGGGEARSRAMAFRAVANIANQQGDPEAAIAATEEALPFFRAHGDVVQVVDCLNALGAAMLAQDDLNRARTYFEESEQLARGLDDTFRLGAAIGNLGNLDLYEGAYDRALERFEQSLELSRALELPEAVASSLANAGLAALLLARHERAAALLRESLELADKIGDVAGVVYAIEALAAVLAEQAEWKKSVELLAGAGAIAESIDLKLQPLEQQMHDRAIGLARAGLGEEAFSADWTSGEAMTQAEITSHALTADV